jgi:uncharacterized protein YsxB (DUF464 family)
MIRITIQRDVRQQIFAFRVSGHAEYDRSGKDIVCAGVSAITVGTVNAIESLLKIRLESSMNKGLLSVSIPHISDVALAEKSQLLLESMVVMLQTIEQSYGKYIAMDNKKI